MGGRVALVVGGGGGIGRKVVAALAAAGARVTIAGRAPALADDAATGLARWADRIAYHAADTADPAECRALVAATQAVWGGLDCVVDCANTPVAGMAGRFAEIDPANLPAFLTSSLATGFNLCHAALPALAVRGGGAMVTFASDSGRAAAPNQTMIGATRAAIMMFARSLALEVAADGIRVNCVSTSFVRDTPVWDTVMAGPSASRARAAAARAGLGLPDADALARLVLFLCSDAAAHLTGQVISMNGGVSA